MRPLDRFLYHQAFFIGELCVLPILAVLLRYNWNRRAKAERSAGKLVLKVVRPRVKLWKTLALVFSWMIIFAQGAFCVFLVSRPGSISADELLKNVTNYVVLLMGVGASWAAWGDAFLELREHGAVCGATYFPWETIREWAWSDRYSTLRLKSSHSVASFRLDPRDTEAVQRVLVAQPTLRMSDHR
jgi:hypothetical protein